MVAEYGAAVIGLCMDDDGIPDEAEGRLAVARKIIERLAEPVRLDGKEAYVGGSVGIAMYPRDGWDYASLIKSADAAMYQAKEAGKARIVTFDQAMHNRNADWAICISHDEAFPAEVGSFNVYGNRILVVDPGDGTLTGVAIMGFLSALIVGPCVAPPLAAALAYIGTTGDAVLGASALFVMSLGMGMPLLLIGLSAGKLLPRAGGWMDAVKAVFGVLMLGVAIYLLERVISPGTAMLLWGTLLVVSAIYMGALSPLPEGTSGWRKLWKGLGVVALIYGALFLVGVAAGGVMVVLPYYLHDYKAFGRITILGEFLAIAALVMCLTFIIVDLGQPQPQRRRARRDRATARPRTALRAAPVARTGSMARHAAQPAVPVVPARPPHAVVDPVVPRRLAAVVRRHPLQSADGDRLFVHAAAPAGGLAGTVAHAAEDSRKHVAGPVDHVCIVEAALRDQSDVLGDVGMGGTAPLAIHNLVEVIRIRSVGALH